MKSELKKVMKTKKIIIIFQQQLDKTKLNSLLVLKFSN